MYKVPLNPWITPFEGKDLQQEFIFWLLLWRGAETVSEMEETLSSIKELAIECGDDEAANFCLLWTKCLTPGWGHMGGLSWEWKKVSKSYIESHQWFGDWKRRFLSVLNDLHVTKKKCFFFKQKVKAERVMDLMCQVFILIIKIYHMKHFKGHRE